MTTLIILDAMSVAALIWIVLTLRHIFRSLLVIAEAQVTTVELYREMVAIYRRIVP